jgi:hypothetical protein
MSSNEDWEAISKSANWSAGDLSKGIQYRIRERLQ